MSYTEEDNKSACGENKKKVSWRGWAIEWVVIPVVGGAITSFLTCWNCFSDGYTERAILSMILGSVFWLLLSHGNSAISIWLDNRISWLHHPVKRLILGVSGLVIYTSLASILVYAIFMVFYLEKEFVTLLSKDWMSFLKFPLLITFFVSLVIQGRHFLLSWKQEAINVEKLKNQNLSSQFESLKNQVNPHFLFNSLNALSSLVYKDQDKAVAFIRKLSEVYRYVLDNQMEEVVQLKDELDFLKSYVFLNKIRFGDNLNVEIADFEGSMNHMMVPPLSLQMLVENAVKHNVISKASRLNVKVFEEDGYLIVSNNLNEKRAIEKPSGVGLKNIESRYGFLTQSPVFIEKKEDQFVVKVPLLKMQNS